MRFTLSKTLFPFMLISLLFQNCDGLRSISSEQQEYLSTNLILSSSSPTTTLEDIKLLAFSRAYEDPQNRLTYEIVTLPKLGDIASFDKKSTQFEYVPKENLNGSDSFDVVAIVDGSYYSIPYNVKIEVTPVNDRPLAKAMAIKLDEDTTVAAALSGDDVEKSKLTFSVAQNPQKGVASVNPDSTVSYTPFKDATGTDTFTFIANDGELSSAPASVTVTITPLNDLPVALNGNLNTNEDVAVNGKLVATDVDGDALTYEIITMPTKGTVNNLVAATGTYTFQPTANAIGADSFTFRARDAIGNSNTATVTINLNNVNDIPVALDLNIQTNEDVQVAVKLMATDADNDKLSFRITTPPVKGTIQFFDAATGSLSFVPNQNANGADSFKYVASDGMADSIIKTVTLNITPANDAPVTQPVAIQTNEDTFIDGNATASDVDGDTLTYSIVTAPLHGTVQFTSGRTFRYTPALNYSGADVFSYRVSDGVITSNTSNVSITINAVNDAPVANNISISTTAGIAKTGNFNASDVEGDSLIYAIVTQPTKGTVTISGVQFTYTPNSGQSGADTFTYRASDGKVNSNTATVSVMIGVSTNGFAILSWNANTETDLKEYLIYYGTSMNNLTNLVANIGLTSTPGMPSYTINGLTIGTTYYFGVKAVNTSGLTSAFSNIVFKTP